MEQHLNSPNLWINDGDAADIVQREKHLEMEAQEQHAFNRDIHQEIEKIHEVRRGSSPSRSDQDAKARRRCILS